VQSTLPPLHREDRFPNSRWLVQEMSLDPVGPGGFGLGKTFFGNASTVDFARSVSSHESVPRVNAEIPDFLLSYRRSPEKIRKKCESAMAFLAKKYAAAISEAKAAD
jgi:hypothetical protein